MEMLQALQDPYLLHSFTRLSHVQSEELDPKGPKEEEALENPDHTSTVEKCSKLKLLLSLKSLDLKEFFLNKKSILQTGL